MFEVREDNLSGDATRQLLDLHLARMRTNSPPEAVHALDLGGLQAPEVTVWSVWEEDDVIGIGALKELGDGTGEVKSMRTHPCHVRRGVAGLLLNHIMAEARARSLTRLSLETGTGPAFQPALMLYRQNGFVEGGAFSHYQPTAFNQFLHLAL